MDAGLLLGLLIVIVTVDTVAILIILALTLRGKGQARKVPPNHASIDLTIRPVAEPRLNVQSIESPASVTVAIPPPDSGAPPEAAVASEPDPLAEAITAFLERSEGVFRSGVVPGVPRPEKTPAPTEPLAESEPPSTPEAPAPPGEPVVASPTTDEPVGAPGEPPTGTGERAAPVANPPGILERPRPDVTWAPARPARYVPSGPRSAAPEDRATREPDAQPLDAPSSTLSAPEPAVPAPPGGEPAALGGGAPTDLPPRHRASRLLVVLAERDPTDSEMARTTIARLGPVIGGMLRERTRGRDRIEFHGQGRFSVFLPGTSVDGADAVGQRLAAASEAWLAAELPPLGLDLRPTDDPGGFPVAEPRPDREPERQPGSERRRSVANDA